MDITQSSARITWTTNELADSRVDYGTTVSYGGSVSEGTLVANHQIDLTGLVPGTTYHFKAFSSDAAANQASSGDFTFTTLADTTPPANVSNLSATPGNQQIALSWTNPADADFAGVRIRRSTTGYPSSPTSGSAVYDGTATTFTDVGLTNGVLYYYTAFAYDSSGNFASGALASGTPVDAIAPGQVMAFSAKAGDAQITLNWTNPADADFSQTIIRRSTSGFPTTPTSGVGVYAGSGTTHVDTGLTNGTLYYYTAFARDTSGNYSGPAQDSATPVAPPPPPPSCGNAICNAGEDNLSCPADCPAPVTCGNAACDAGETHGSCPADCPAPPPPGPSCGNSACESGENHGNCPADCPAPPPGPTCGNTVCEAGENHVNCSLDCQPPAPPVKPPQGPQARAMDASQIEYLAMDRTLPLVPDRAGFLHVLSQETMTIIIPITAFEREVDQIVLNYANASYLFSRSANGQSYVVDVTVPKVGAASRSAALPFIKTAQAAEATSYPGSIIVRYEDATNDTASFKTSIESRSYVHENDGGWKPVAGATVTLDQRSGSNWVTWNGSFYAQQNPVASAADGSYAWMVPVGEYRIRVVKEGFRAKETAPFMVDDQIVNVDIELIRTPPPLIDVIVPGAPFTENVGNIIRNLGQQTSYITKIFQKDVIQDPRVEQGAGAIAVPAAAVITTAIVVTAVQATSIASYLYFLITQPLLLIARRRRKEFGTVYNTLSKIPVDLAIVRLFRTNGRLVRTIVTDKQGRYAFLVEEGEYRIEATKPTYKFPSELTAGKKEDGRYPDIYHGEPIKVGSDGAIITANIPLDPITGEKSNRRIILESIGRKLQSGLALGSVLFTAVVFLVYRKPYLLVLLIVQILLYMIFRRLAVPPKPKNWGIVYDEKTKKPVPYAVARIVESKYNKVLESRVTDSKGRYNFLVGNNKYFVSVEKPGYETKKSDEIDLTGADSGVVDIDIGVKAKDNQPPPSQP